MFCNLGLQHRMGETSLPSYNVQQCNDVVLYETPSRRSPDIQGHPVVLEAGFLHSPFSLSNPVSACPIIAPGQLVTIGVVMRGILGHNLGSWMYR